MSDLIRMSSSGTVRIVRLSLPHTVDSGEFDQLNDSLLSVLEDKPAGGWVLDLSGLTYAGSSVLGLLVNFRQRIKQAGGRLALFGLSNQLLQIFHTCSLERLFVIRKTEDDAISRVE